MSYVTTEIEDQIAVLSLNRPDAKNAIDAGVLDEIDGAITALENAGQTRVVIFRSQLPKVFAAGGDIRAMRAMSLLEGRSYLRQGHTLLSRLEQSHLISVAAVGGYALGGGTELALACDIRIASIDAVFGLPEVSIGLFPGWGGTQRLGRVVGSGWARYLTLTAKRVDAETALKIGLVTQLAEEDALLPTAIETANSVINNGPMAVAYAKSAMVYGNELPLHYGLQFEQESWLTNFGTSDRIEGLSAFLERRKPEWGHPAEATS